MSARSAAVARLFNGRSMCLATLLLITSAASNSRLEAQPPSSIRKDALGDPLPQGAIARLGTLRFKHEPGRFIAIRTAVFAPNGKYIVSLSEDRSMRLWDVATGKEVPGPWSPGQQFSAVTFSPDGVHVAVASLRGTLNKDKDLQWEILVFHIANAAREQTVVYDSMIFDPKVPSFPREGVIQALAFTDGGKTLVAARDNSVTWWDVATGKKRRTRKLIKSTVPHRNNIPA